MKNMKKILVLALAALLLVAVSVAGTVAYLTASTTPVTNTFKPSTLSVTLTEQNPTDTDNREIQMVPGASVAKDPKVSYTTDVPAYVFVKVTESIGGNLQFDKYIGYSVITGENKWTELGNGVYYMDVVAGAKNDISIIQDKTAPTPVADHVTVNNLTLADMNALKDLGATGYPKLTFEAYIIQKEPFNDASAAWTELTTPSSGT